MLQFPKKDRAIKHFSQYFSEGPHELLFFIFSKKPYNKSCIGGTRRWPYAC
jgi:hypothetical protein